MIHKNTPTSSGHREPLFWLFIEKPTFQLVILHQSKDSSLLIFSEYHLLSGALPQAVHLAQGRLHPGDAAVLHQVAPHRARPAGLQREDRRGLRALSAGGDARQLLQRVPGVDPVLCGEDRDGTSLTFHSTEQQN